MEPVPTQKSRVLQETISCTQTQQPVETHLGPEHVEHLPKHTVGDTRDKRNLPTGRGVGYLHRFQRRILPHTHSIYVFTSRVSPTSSKHYPLPVHSSHGIHSGGQRGQTDGFTEGYKNPPVARRLVRARSHQTCLQHTQTVVALC